MTGIALLGAGAIAGVHADACGQWNNRCEVRAVCDLYPDKAKALIEKKGLRKAAAYGDIDAVLARDDIDAVFICLPPDVHASVAIRALNAGKHVLVEKPMAASLQECDAMIEAAAAAKGKILSPVAQNRFRTPNARVKRMIRSGDAGRVLYATVNSLWWRGGNYYDIWWRGTWEKECGGCFTSHAVHHIDLLLWMLGKPERVTAVIANVGHDNSECEDLGVAILEYTGMLAQISASLVTHDEEQELIFQTDRGRLSVPWRTAASKALPNGFPEEDVENRNALQRCYENIPELTVEGHPAQIGNFLDAISGDAPLQVTGEEGRNAIELIMAIYKASLERAPVTLPIGREDPFYRRETMAAAMPRFHQKTRSVENFTTSEITLGRDVGK
ncbi:MAG: Gfo/Idh/MocA family oxidoreductase [Synergistaceae bacterium]|jgi:predicted dehydrogenase|nr:Gfo/Idh/MocA family oxidoreductase [Synergistaceae bacterium]